MRTDKANRKKERSVGHKSKNPDGHHKKDRGPDLKIACLIFKGKKHDDPDPAMHIQAFEQYAELAHIGGGVGRVFSSHIEGGCREKEAPRARSASTYQVHTTLKLEQQAKKEKSRHYSNSDFSTSASSEAKNSSSDSSESEEDERKKNKKDSLSRKINKMIHHLEEGKDLFMIAFASMEPIPVGTDQQQQTVNTSGYNRRGKGRGKGGNTDFKRNFNCYKCGKYGHFAAQSPDPLKPATQEAKQPEPVPVRAITKSFGIVIEELPVEKPVPSKLNPKAKEWEHSRSTWNEKAKAKEFDEWKDQRELVAKITENLEKKKPEAPKCFEVRSLQRIPVAVTEALLLKTQDVGTCILPIDSFEDSSNSNNEQDEIKFIKEKRKQAEITIVLLDKLKAEEQDQQFLKHFLESNEGEKPTEYDFSSEDVESNHTAETRTDKEAEAMANRKSGLPN
ncbi:hypothetical protein L7F22_001095 [Adiantum nelumboides]|nr:hypothetical protein [Adiantum nelumboides]